ncbi:NAD-dependent epimerase/dehydratase family protein [Derxia gummosa]|uniref:NAD-dependent epimerase/dehydratase family protein n=1 Tax=Derxia gummosa DSM 723 TaxID=1121388 RepID=A0A8B6X4K7_9BURK|nr:NAD-dependent epimerase/dehydratase family protein [Derxia gummosa]
MHVLVTGAAGFVGRALVARLLAGAPALPRIDRLTLIDLAFADGDAGDPRVTRLAGSITDAALVTAAFAAPVDAIFHLASLPGGAAERDPLLGRAVNLDATLALLDAARAQSLAGRAPVFVFASTIAVLGAPLPAGGVDDATPCAPALSYGAHKLAAEVLAADAARRGWADVRSLRLPGIVARPPAPSGLLSAFTSDLIRELAAGRPFACPVPARATAWLMSVPCVVDNLLHAAAIDGARFGTARVCTLPALRLSFGELAAAVGAAWGTNAQALASWGEDAALEANFGRHPPLATPLADAAGFRHDGDAVTLARRALEI